MGKRNLKSGKPKVTLAKSVFDLRGEYVGGQPENSGMIEVANPHNAEQRIVVFRALRADPLAGMHDRDQLRTEAEREDDARTGRNRGEARYHAGRHWQKAYELAEIGGARAIDPTVERVDGGQIPQRTVTDSQARAIQDLALATKKLGEYGDSIVRDVLARHMTLSEVAAYRMKFSRPERDALGYRFRECLETLAEIFGYAVPRKT